MNKRPITWAVWCGPHFVAQRRLSGPLQGQPLQSLLKRANPKKLGEFSLCSIERGLKSQDLALNSELNSGPHFEIGVRRDKDELKTPLSIPGRSNLKVRPLAVRAYPHVYGDLATGSQARNVFAFGGPLSLQRQKRLFGGPLPIDGPRFRTGCDRIPNHFLD